MSLDRSNGMPDENIGDAPTMLTNTPPPMLTVAAAARRIGVSLSKVYQLTAARQIAHFRVGGKIVFREADIEAYLTSCRVTAVTPAVTAPRMPRVRLNHIKLEHVALAGGEMTDSATGAGSASPASRGPSARPGSLR